MKQALLRIVVNAFFLFAFFFSSGQTCENCGIGTSSPSSKLQIQGCGTTSLTSSFNVTDSNSIASLFFIRDDGHIGLLSTSPTSFFQLRAGTAAANSSPLKFLSGTNLTTPEAGAVEFDGTRLYYTTSTPTRITLLGNNFGITGGSTLVGGTAASDNLTLSSTSNATKGKILFGTSAYNEATNELGIGTTSPAAPLDVNGSIRGAYRTSIASYFSTLRVGLLSGETDYFPGIENYLMGSNNYALIQDSAGITYLNSASGQPLDFRIGNADQMHLTTTGLGIGTTSPGATLDVNGSIRGNYLGTTPSYVNALKIGYMISSDDFAGISYYNLPSTEYALLQDDDGGTYLNAASSTYPIHFRINNASDIMTMTTTGLGIGTTTPGASLDVNGSIRGNYLGTTPSYFNNLLVGYIGVANAAGIGYYNMTSGNYALLQNSSGVTLLNAASSQAIEFGIGGTTIMNMTSTGLILGASGAASAQLELDGGHIKSIGTIPTIAITTASGILGIAIGSGSTDVKGFFSPAGSNNNLANTVITITFHVAYNVAPIVVITDRNASAQTCTYFVTSTTTTLVFNYIGGGVSPSFYYYVIE